MKFELLLSRLAAIGFVAAAAGLAFNAFALALFACATGTLVVLVAANDYSRRTGYTPAPVPVRRREILPLAS